MLGILIAVVVIYAPTAPKKIDIVTAVGVGVQYILAGEIINKRKNQYKSTMWRRPSSDLIQSPSRNMAVFELSLKG